VKTARVPLIMRIPPPLIFVATFLTGAGLQRALPPKIESTTISRAVSIAGMGLTAAGFLIALSCLALFLAARTTVIPFGTATSLISRGPYRLTRNPMYVSLVLVYLGVAGILVELWPLVLLPLPVAILHWVVVPFEETRLRATFGAAFDEYCGRARRWL